MFPNPAVSYAREGAGLTEFFQMEQALPAFGLRDALERAGVAARESADAERDARLWQLRIDAHVALARWRAAAERLEAARSVERLVEQLIGVLATREREGEGSRASIAFDRNRNSSMPGSLVSSAEVDRLAARGALLAMLPPDTPLPDTIARTSVSRESGSGRGAGSESRDEPRGTARSRKHRPAIHPRSRGRQTGCRAGGNHQRRCQARRRQRTTRGPEASSASASHFRFSIEPLATSRDGMLSVRALNSSAPSSRRRSVPKSPPPPPSSRCDAKSRRWRATR